jgi:mono/diheme cytochrome c family protein
VGLGAVTLAVAVLAVVAWLAFLMTQSRARDRRPEPPPPHPATPIGNAELEGRRLNTTLLSALIAAAILAIVLPVYYLSESGHQADAVAEVAADAVERGEHWYEEFQCGDCHGPDGSGGGAAYVEPRSGLTTTWAAPPLDDVLYRYDEDEVRYWLVYGRQGSPMPAWGAAGGGPLNSQQIDDLVAYLDAIRLDQQAVLAAVDGRVDRAVSRRDDAAGTVAEAIAGQRDEIARIESAAADRTAVQDLPGALQDALTGPGTCTRSSAGLVELPCDDAGADGDRDGLADAAEAALGDLLARMIAAAPPSEARDDLERIAASPAAEGGVAFDPANAFSTVEGNTPVPDLDRAEELVVRFEAIDRDTRLLADNRERLLDSATAGLDALEEAAAAARWEIDIGRVADAVFSGDRAAAGRAAGLYDAFCARCHTSGYSAGVVFTREAGSGAFGPSLLGGRSSVQFPEPQDQYEFLVSGSENGKAYGVNGVGRGWMPGFGPVLTEADIRLIVEFVRALE